MWLIKQLTRQYNQHFVVKCSHMKYYLYKVYIPFYEAPLYISYEKHCLLILPLITSLSKIKQQDCLPLRTNHIPPKNWTLQTGRSTGNTAGYKMMFVQWAISREQATPLMSPINWGYTLTSELEGLTVSTRLQRAWDCYTIITTKQNYICATGRLYYDNDN